MLATRFTLHLNHRNVRRTTSYVSLFTWKTACLGMCVYLNVLWVSNVCVPSEEINVFFHQTHTKIPAVSGKIYIHWQSNVLGSESFIKSEPVPECVWVITGSFNCLTPTHTHASAHTWIIDSLSRRRIIPVIHLVEVEVLQCDEGVEKGSEGMKRSSHKLETLQSKDIERSQAGDYIIIIYFSLILLTQIQKWLIGLILFLHLTKSTWLREFRYRL